MVTWLSFVPLNKQQSRTFCRQDQGNAHETQFNLDNTDVYQHLGRRILVLDVT